MRRYAIRDGERYDDAEMRHDELMMMMFMPILIRMPGASYGKGERAMILRIR